MIPPLEQLPSFGPEGKSVQVIIETGKGSPVKYSYQPKAGMFYAKRLLPPGMMFPFNFGFIPSTIGDDGDPLDVLILNDIPLVCGCLVKAELVAVVRAEQSEGGRTFRNDRLIGSVLDEESPSEFLEFKLDARRVAEIGYFFNTYNQFSGKEFKVLGTGSAEEARRLVQDGQQKFKDHQAAGSKT
jgi:inorganic pyrophosphatase